MADPLGTSGRHRVEVLSGFYAVSARDFRPSTLLRAGPQSEGVPKRGGGQSTREPNRRSLSLRIPPFCVGVIRLEIGGSDAKLR